MGDGRVERLSAIGDSGNTTIALILDIDDTVLVPCWIHSICFPGGSDSKGCACSVGDQGSIPGSGRSPGEGNGSPFQYTCLENPMHRGAWQPIVHGVAKSQT